MSFGQFYLLISNFLLLSCITKFEDTHKDMILIEGGVFEMGADENIFSLDREHPKHPVYVNSFYMDKHEVTNKEFKRFVDATGYVTLAEKKVYIKDTSTTHKTSTFAPGSLVFTPKEKNNIESHFSWWKWTVGANWKHPNGPESNIEKLDNYPVVHISYEDATAYANWCNKRLPTEAEWEYAARGGLKNNIYPWGNEPVSSNFCNYWTGQFPYFNDTSDGYYGLAPVMKFQPNNFDLYDMAGNVWEICSDWFDQDYYLTLSTNEPTKNPKGPTNSYYPIEGNEPKKVIKGGSFLCNDSYCASYRVAARMPHSIETTTNHVGFRCVVDIK